MKQKMTKNLLGLIVTIVSLVLLATTLVTAGSIATINDVEIDGVNANSASVVAGEYVTIEVQFTATKNDTEVTIEAEMEVNGEETRVVSSVFDVEAGKSYEKVLTLRVPFDLDDDVSDDGTLEVEIDGKDHDETATYDIRVQRPTFNAELKSVVIPQNIDAGDSFPVDVVVKNVGYNDLDDTFVTVAVPALGLVKTGYLGDLVAIEGCDACDDDDDEDTVMARLYLEVPYEAQAGVYTLEVTVENDDTTSETVRQFAVGNDVENRLIVTDSRETVAVGEEAEYSLLLVNPTDKLKVYRVVVDSNDDVSAQSSDAVVAVPAGSSRNVVITAEAQTAGEYDIVVNVFSGENLEESATLQLEAEGRSVANPVVILTIVLAIIFVVLLVVLIVLVTKKPEKSEEFGESYY